MQSVAIECPRATPLTMDGIGKRTGTKTRQTVISVRKHLGPFYEQFI